MYDLKTINITLKAFDHNVLGLESHLNEHFDVISYKVLPNTEGWYENDPHFKKLVKEEKRVKRIKADYIQSKK